MERHPKPKQAEDQRGAARHHNWNVLRPHFVPENRCQRSGLEFAALPFRTDITLSSSVSGLTTTPTHANSISFQLWSPHFTVASGSGLEGLFGELSQCASS